MGDKPFFVRKYIKIIWREDEMGFTYDAYQELLNKLREHGYRVADYKNWRNMGRCVILRHDIDNDIDQALKLSALEKHGGGDKHIFCPSDIGFLQCFFQKEQ